MNVNALVRVFGKWPSFILLLLATIMPLLVALIDLFRS